MAVAADAPSDDPSDPVDDPVEEVSALQVETVSVEQVSADAWQTVRFDGPIEDAVVIMGPVSANGGQAALTRVRNVTEDGFEFQIEEWDHLDGYHKEVEVTWMAASAGDYELEDGRKVSFGATSAADERPTDVSLDGFDAPPIIVSQVGSYNGNQAVATRTSDVTEDGFSVRMQEMEASDGEHRPETVYWMAVEEGEGALSAMLIGGGVDHQWVDSEIVMPDHVLADMQSFNGPNTASLRFDETDDNTLALRVQDERSLDNEIWHVTEQVGAVFTNDEALLLTHI